MISTSSQNDVTLYQLYASITGHKSRLPLKGVNWPEIMFTTAIKATLQSYHVSAIMKLQILLDADEKAIELKYFFLNFVAVQDVCT